MNEFDSTKLQIRAQFITRWKKQLFDLPIVFFQPLVLCLPVNTPTKLSAVLDVTMCGEQCFPSEINRMSCNMAETCLLHVHTMFTARKVIQTAEEHIAPPPLFKSNPLGITRLSLKTA